MNTKKILITLIVSCLISCENSQEMNNIADGNEIELRSGDSGSFDYTVIPGTEAWNQLVTEQERIDVLQIPEGILDNLSPDDAVRLYITFPSFGHFTAFNTPQEGFDIMLSRYNILRHILSRKDVGGSLIAVYKDATLSGFKTLPYSNDFWSLKLFYIELMLSQKDFLKSLTTEEKLELITEVRTKYFEKLGDENFSSLPEALFSLKIMASILYVDEYHELMSSSQRDTIIEFINTGWLFEKAVPIEEIGSMIDNYINNKG